MWDAVYSGRGNDMRLRGGCGTGIGRPETSRCPLSKADLQHHAAILILEEFLRAHVQYEGSGCHSALRLKLNYAGQQDNDTDKRRRPPTRACGAESDGRRPG